MNPRLNCFEKKRRRSLEGGARNHFRKVRPALPAGIALLCTLAVFISSAASTAAPTAADFRAYAAASIQAGRFKEAVIWLRRELAKDPSAMEPRMQLLTAYSGMRQTEALVELLNQIAPGDRLVYGPAHLFRAQLMMAAGGDSSQSRAQARRCLDLALLADPKKGQGTVDHSLAHSLVAELQAAAGDWQGVLVSTGEVGAPTPATLLLRASALKALGGKADANAAADAALREIDRVFTGTALEDRLRRASGNAQAWMVKDEVERAMAAISAEGQEPRMQELLVSVTSQAARYCRTESGRDSKRWLDCIAKGLTALPDNLELTSELIAGHTYWTFQPGFSGRAVTRLTELGCEGHARLLAALVALAQGQQEDASRDFARACELLPGNPIIANNHAAILGTGNGGTDPEIACVMIDQVLKEHPGVGAFQDTKGRILLKLGRPQDACKVLEGALKAANDPGTHLALADAYAALGKSDLAATHRKLAVGK